MCGKGSLGIVPDRTVTIKRNECHQPSWPCFWFYLRLLLWSLLVLSPGVGIKYGLTCVLLGQEILGLTCRFDSWAADSPLDMTFRTDSRVCQPLGVRPLSRETFGLMQLSPLCRSRCAMRTWGLGESSLAQGWLVRSGRRWVFAFYFYFK